MRDFDLAVIGSGPAGQRAAVASFDDPYFGQLLEPALTALTSKPVEMGRLAASLLLDAIRGVKLPVRDVRLPVELVRRASCGCIA